MDEDLLINKILSQVRAPEAIKIKAVEFSASNLELKALVNYSRLESFPNKSLAEVTGGQLIDSISQTCFLLPGFSLEKGKVELGFNFDTYLKALNLHRVNFIKINVSFHAPCAINKDFAVKAKLVARKENIFFRKLQRQANLSYLLEVEVTLSQDSSSGKNLIAKGIVKACLRA